MGLLTFPFKLPLLPVRGVLQLARIIQEEAEKQAASPATIRRELEEIAQRQAAGEISDTEAAQLQREAVARFRQASGAAQRLPTAVKTD